MPRLLPIDNNPPALERPVNNDDATTSRANTTVPRTATEQADSLLASITHPDLNRYLHEVSSLPPSERIQQALVNFQNDSEAFKSFSDEMRSCLLELQTKRFGGPRSAQHFENYMQLIKDLELHNPKHGSEKYGTQLFQLYSDGCLLFKQLLTMLSKAQEGPKDFPSGALDACQPLVNDLESELLICGDGLMQKLASQTTEIRHTLFPPNFLELLENKRIKTAEAFIREKVVPILNLGPYLEGNEIHVVKTWMDKLKPKLNLKSNSFDDRFANQDAYFNSVPFYTRLQIIHEMAGHISHRKIIDELAWETFDEIQCALSELPDQQRNDYGEVESCVLKPLTKQFGSLPITAFLRPSVEARAELHHEPSLLIAELLDKCKGKSAQQAAFDLKPITFPISEDGKLTLCLWHKSCWTEFKTDKRSERGLLELDDVSDAKALEVIRGIAGQHETAANFIAAPFLNHPVHGPIIAPLLSGRPHYWTIATAAYLCSIAHEAEPSRFTDAFEFMVKSYEIRARSITDVLSQANFSDKQIDAALARIKASNLSNLNWAALRFDCLTPRSNTLNPLVFKTIMQGMTLESEMLDNAIASFAAKGNIANLKLMLETFTDSEMDRSKAAIIRLKNQAEPTTNPEAIDYLLSLVQDEDDLLSGYQNLLEYSILWTTDDIAAKVASNWINNGGTDFLNAMGMNALGSAAAMHALKTLRILIENENFQAQHTDRHNLTALDHVLLSLNAKPDMNPETALTICELLLSRGVSPNHLISPNKKTWHAALHNNLNEPDSTRLLKLFLQAGARELDDTSSTNAVDFACARLQPEKLDALLEYPERFKASEFSLHLAVSSNLVQMDLQEGAATLDNLQRKIAIIEILKPTPADLDRLDQAGKTPVDYAIDSDNHVLVLAMFKQAGGINALDQEGYARLHKAVINKDQALVRLLVEAGANPNLRSGVQHVGKTAMHFAVRNKDESMQTLLKNLGANPTIRDHRGRTANNFQSWKRNS